MHNIHILSIYTIMITSYYKLSEAIRYATTFTYIVGWFQPNRHQYLSFASYDDFCIGRHTYSSLHELIIYADGSNNTNIFTSRRDGRLCFDFDLKMADIDSTFDVKMWMTNVESVIKDIATTLYHEIDPAILKFVWSTSDNPTKVSKHLTVKNLYYEDWILMSRQFYRMFVQKWNFYPAAGKFVDKQIIRKNAALRFVGSTKPDGSSVLRMDDPTIPFEDSLIRPTLSWYSGNEQYVSYDKLKFPCYPFREATPKTMVLSNHCPIDTNHFLDERAFRPAKNITYRDDEVVIHKYHRIGPSYCNICDRIHHRENAYVKFHNGAVTYHCYRELDKNITIGNCHKISNASFAPKIKKELGCYIRIALIL